MIGVGGIVAYTKRTACGHGDGMAATHSLPDCTDLRLTTGISEAVYRDVHGLLTAKARLHVGDSYLSYGSFCSTADGLLCITALHPSCIRCGCTSNRHIRTRHGQPHLITKA